MSSSQTQSTLPIGDARPYFVFALILATIALGVYVVPFLFGVSP